jgi:hypothetical protein
MLEPTPPLDLAAIAARCATYEYSVVQWEEAAATLILTDVPALVARVRALEAENAELTEAVTELEDAHDTSEAMLARVRAASPDRDAVILADVLRALRLACAEVGDNDWPDDLHPADVIEKHLLRPVLARLRELGD